MLDLAQAQPKPTTPMPGAAANAVGTAKVTGKPHDCERDQSKFEALIETEIETAPETSAELPLGIEIAQVKDADAAAGALQMAASKAGQGQARAAQALDLQTLNKGEAATFVAGVLTPEGLPFDVEIDDSTAIIKNAESIKITPPAPAPAAAPVFSANPAVAPASGATPAMPVTAEIGDAPQTTGDADVNVDADGGADGVELANRPTDTGRVAAFPQQTLRGQARAEANATSGTHGSVISAEAKGDSSEAKLVSQMSAAGAANEKSARVNGPAAQSQPDVDLAALGADGAEVEAEARPDRAQSFETARAGNERAQMDRVSLGRMFAPAGATPLRDFAAQVTRRIAGGANTFQIRLDPAELGKVDVTMEMKGDKATLRLTVERVETLELLSRDARSLERALADAGVKADAGSMEFQLGREGTDEREGHGGASLIGLGGGADDANPAERAQAYRATRADALLDLFV